MTGVRHDTTRASVLGHWLVCALVVSSAAAAAADQSREDAWWTGPMLAPSAATLPTGHMLLEPYLFDVMTDGRFDMHGTRRAGAREHDIGSLSYILYGLTDRLSVGLIPRFIFNEPAGAPSSSGVGIGDLSLQAGYGLTRFQDGQRMPALALVLDETLPTGRYQRLGRASDGLGGGVRDRPVDLFPGLPVDAQWADSAGAAGSHLRAVGFRGSAGCERLRDLEWISRPRVPRRFLHRGCGRGVQPHPKLGAGARCGLSAQR